MKGTLVSTPDSKLPGSIWPVLAANRAPTPWLSPGRYSHSTYEMS